LAFSINFEEGLFDSRFSISESDYFKLGDKLFKLNPLVMKYVPSDFS